MDDRPPELLDQLSTNWALLRKAHGPCEDERQRAQEAILERYTPAIYRYLRGATRDPDLAWDLFQDFALRFVRGDFRTAEPRRGRFRDYIRRVLRNLVADHHRQRQPQPLLAETTVAAPGPSSADKDAFVAHWRDQLIRHAFDALQAHEQQTGQSLYRVLRSRTDQPEASAASLAEFLGEQLGRSITPEWVRNRLHLARQVFGDLVVSEVARSLPLPCDDDIADELADLGLLDACRGALARRRGG